MHFESSLYLINTTTVMNNLCRFSHRRPRNESNKRIFRTSPEAGTRYCARLQILDTKQSSRNADLKSMERTMRLLGKPFMQIIWERKSQWRRSSSEHHPPFHPLDTPYSAQKPYTKPTSCMDGEARRRTIKLCTNMHIKSCAFIHGKYFYQMLTLFDFILHSESVYTSIHMSHDSSPFFYLNAAGTKLLSF